MGVVEDGGRGEAEGSWRKTGQVISCGADWPVDVVM